MTHKSKRLAFFLICDIFLLPLSVFLAFELRFSGEIPSIFYPALIKVCIILSLLKLAFLALFRIYSVAWRFFSLNEARKIFIALALAELVFLGIFYMQSDFFNPFPRSVVGIDFVLSYLFIGSLRISKRMFIDFKRPKFDEETPCIVLGATSKALHLLKGAKEGSFALRPVAVIDERRSLIGTYCDKFKVQGKDALAKYAKDGVKTAVIALKLAPNALKSLFDELVAVGITDIKIFSFTSNEARDISIEDLLARKPKDLDSKAVSEFLRAKVVLVSGAGGSIGSELCEQVLKFGAKRLIMLENSEFNLYQITEKLRDFKGQITPILMSILDTQGLDALFEREKIDLILHAAAYKHLSICEQNPVAAVLNNVLGTKILLDTARKKGIKKFVMISTDKAVRPSSVMGCTKRVCELYVLGSSKNFASDFLGVADKGVEKSSKNGVENVSKNGVANDDTGVKANTLETCCVRFGNVLGSSGSVVPKFKAQIAANEPLSVTHPDITRYFMLTSEAVQLVLQAAAIAHGGELFVLDMGKAVKIADLAQKMLILAGKSHLGLRFTGLRRGEKLYEELLIDESKAKTKYKSIFVAEDEGLAGADFEKLNSQINKLVKIRDKGEILALLKQIVPEFKHNDIDEKL